MSDSCANCRLHSSFRRPKVIGETGFGDQLMFSDDDETVYVCRAEGTPESGRAVGPTPVLRTDCSSWSPPNAGSDRLNAIDEMIARRERARSKDGV